MSWLSSHGNIFSGLGAVANFIPGVGPAIGAGLAGIGGLLSAGEAQGQANKARDASSAYLANIQNLLNKQLTAANQDPYAPAGPYDQYSPAWNEAVTGAFRDDTAKALQGQLAGIDYNLRPAGGARSSAMEYAKAQALRDASAQNAAFMRNLRIQGGVERYNNMVRASDEKFRRQQAVMGQMTGLGQQYQSQYQTEQQNANNIYGGLANSVAAMMQAGLGKGPRGGKTGPIRGDNQMNTGRTGNAGVQVPAGSAAGVGGFGLPPVPADPWAGFGTG